MIEPNSTKHYPLTPVLRPFVLEMFSNIVFILDASQAQLCLRRALIGRAGLPSGGFLFIIRRCFVPQHLLHEIMIHQSLVPRLFFIIGLHSSALCPPGAIAWSLLFNIRPRRLVLHEIDSSGTFVPQVPPSCYEGLHPFEPRLIFIASNKMTFGPFQTIASLHVFTPLHF